jgi:hypothetical protein
LYKFGFGEWFNRGAGGGLAAGTRTYLHFLRSLHPSLVALFLVSVSATLSNKTLLRGRDEKEGDEGRVQGSEEMEVGPRVGGGASERASCLEKGDRNGGPSGETATGSAIEPFAEPELVQLPVSPQGAIGRQGLQSG